MEISGKGSLKIRYYDDGSKGPVVQCSSIAKMIKASTKNDPDKSIRALIGKPQEYEDIVVYPLLIKNGDWRGE